MTRNDKILADLSRHLRERVMQSVGDHMDNCRIARLSYRDASTDLMCFFSHLASSFAVSQFEVDEEEFLQIMRIQFRQAQKHEEER